MNKKAGTKNKQQDICSNCGAVMKNDKICLVCGAPKGKEQVKEPRTQHSDTISLTRFYRNRGLSKTISVVLVVVLLVAGIAVALGQYASYLSRKSTYNAGNSVVYQSNNHSLKIKLATWENPIVIDKYYLNRTNDIRMETNADSRFVAYLGNQRKDGAGVKGDLLLVDLLDLEGKSDFSSVKKLNVSDQLVVDFLFMEKGNILILLTENGELFACDFSKMTGILPTRGNVTTKQLDTNVSGICDSAGLGLLYFKAKSPLGYIYEKGTVSSGEFDLYLGYLDEKSFETKLVDTGANGVFDAKKECGNIIYTKAADDNAKNRFSVWYYQSQPDGVSKQLAESVSKIVDGDATIGSLLYLSSNPLLVNIPDLIRDDMLEGDILIADPAKAVEETEAEVVGEEEETTPEELEELTKIYGEKVLRDRVRQRLKNLARIYELSGDYYSYSLYMQESSLSNPFLITDNALSFGETEDTVVSGIGAGYVLFSTQREKAVLKSLSGLTPQKIDEILGSDYSLKKLISENVSESLMLYNLKTKEAIPVYTEKGDRVIRSFDFSSDFSRIYFMSDFSYDENIGTLYLVNLGEGSVSETVYVDDYVYRLIGEYYDGAKSILYQTSSMDETPEYIIYYYSDGNVIELARKTDSADYVNLLGENHDQLYFYRDYDDLLGYGSLFHVNGETEILVAEELKEYSLLSSGSFVFTQYSSGDTALLSRNQEKNTLIDESIKTFKVFDSRLYPIS